MEKKSKNYSELWMAISFGLAIWFYIYHNGENKRIISGIRNHTLDTIYSNDTMYVVNPKIDTLYYYPHEIEPKEKPY